MTSKLERARRKAQQLRQLPPGERRQAVKRYAGRNLVRNPANLSSFSPGAVTRYWASERRTAIWGEVEGQLRAAAADRSTLELFVRTGLEHTWSPEEAICLARHPLSTEVVRRWLLEQLDPDRPDDQRVIGRQELHDAAYVAAARLLLAPADVERLRGLAQRGTSDYFQIIDSVGWPARADAGHAPARHRLVLAEHLANRARIAALLPGCEEATLFAASDTFGMADFSDYAHWVGSGNVHVEHIRTRTTRFSADYIRLHEATARVADAIVGHLATIPGLLREDDRSFLAVDVADALFFQAVKIHAIDRLLDDASFDHVVIAIGEQGPMNEFLRILAATPRIKDDPRVEIVSTAGEMRWRGKFWQSLDAILAPAPRRLGAADLLPVDKILDSFAADARTYAAEMQWDAREVAGGILMATVDNAAYDRSTAAYLAELQGTGPVTILHAGANATGLRDALDRLGVPAPPIAQWPPLDLGDHAACDLLTRRLAPVATEISRAASDAFEAAAAAAFEIALERIVATRIVPALMRHKMLDLLFARWSEAGCLPGAVLLTPHRDPRVGEFAAVARRFGVPSIALEPHMQDANYSRYIKIAADYYGVFSEYFVANAVDAFGMQPDRVRVVGTPRHVAPPAYDRAAAQAQARAAMAAETGFDFSSAPLHVVFFCQPGDWSQVCQVWDLVLDAADKVDAHVFAKPHPEESPSRVRRYLDRVQERGHHASVTLLSGPAEHAVDIADVVITSYSATAVDAAVRSTPVVSVAPGDTTYPIDVAAIVDAPIARSVEELAEVLRAFLADPGPALARARALLERESHFVTGPGPALRQLVADAMAKGPGGLRSGDELPDSLFLDGPHPVFSV